MFAHKRDEGLAAMILHRQYTGGLNRLARQLALINGPQQQIIGFRLLKIFWPSCSRLPDFPAVEQCRGNLI